MRKMVAFHLLVSLPSPLTHGDFKANLGCLGLYVHDLTYNAQKPARVTTQDGESLINFERYRTTAKIVKSLLRLIDASTRYRFEPVPGIIERCLWIASLSEEQVQLRSKQLE